MINHRLTSKFHLNVGIIFEIKDRHYYYSNIVEDIFDCLSIDKAHVRKKRRKMVFQLFLLVTFAFGICTIRPLPLNFLK